MSNSAKKSPSSRSKTAQSTSERKPALSIIKDIQPDAGAGQTRRQYTAEEKIRIVLEGLQENSQSTRFVDEKDSTAGTVVKNNF